MALAKKSFLGRAMQGAVLAAALTGSGMAAADANDVAEVESAQPLQTQNLSEEQKTLFTEFTESQQEIFLSMDARERAFVMMTRGMNDCVSGLLNDPQWRAEADVYQAAYDVQREIFEKATVAYNQAMQQRSMKMQNAMMEESSKITQILEDSDFMDVMIEALEEGKTGERYDSTEFAEGVMEILPNLAYKILASKMDFSEFGEEPAKPEFTLPDLPQPVTPLEVCKPAFDAALVQHQMSEQDLGVIMTGLIKKYDEAEILDMTKMQLMSPQAPAMGAPAGGAQQIPPHVLENMGL